MPIFVAERYRGQLAGDGQPGQDGALRVLDGIENLQFVEFLLILRGELRAAGFEAVGAGAGVENDGQMAFARSQF
jgi:hypothetical protein